MFECIYAQRLWECIKDFTSVKPPRLHPNTWANDLLIGIFCKIDEVSLIACGGWSLWTGRNKRNHGKTDWGPNAAAKFVTKMIEDILGIFEKEEKGS